MRAFLEEFGLYLAWLVAIVATLGSLYFSEVRHFVPCVLCWYQRIFMYPLVFVLGVASFRRDPGVRVYALPLSVIGGLISIYHIMVENIPSLAATAVCQMGVPCSLKYINWFGFITIPTLALTAFTLITALLVALPRRPRA